MFFESAVLDCVCHRKNQTNHAEPNFSSHLHISKIRIHSSKSKINSTVVVLRLLRKPKHLYGNVIRIEMEEWYSQQNLT